MSDFSRIKNKLRKLVLFVLAIAFLVSISQEIWTYPHIPLKGLFRVLKKDDIGFAHALLHAGWIENMYQYGQGKPHRQEKIKGGKTSLRAKEENDAVANLVRKFWFRKSEDHQLLPTQFGFLANIPNDQLGKIFGLLINCVYKGFQKKQKEELVYAIIACDPQKKEWDEELGILTKDLLDQEYALEYDRRSDELRIQQKAKDEQIKQVTRELEKKFNMRELKQKIAFAKQNLNKREVKKEIQALKKEFKKSEYIQALTKAKERIFAETSIEREILDEYESIEKRVKELKEQINKKIRKKRKPIKKNVCKPIIKALELCKKGEDYESRATEGILWALFFHKIDRLATLEEKIKVINDCIDRIDITFKNSVSCTKKKLGDLYQRKDFDLFKQKITDLEVDAQATTIFENYDLALHSFIYCATGKFPPVIAQRSYGYEYEEGKISHERPDCNETALLDVLSILWYNPAKKTYDDSLFSKEVIKNGQGLKKLRQALKYLYLADCKGIRVEEYMDQYASHLIGAKGKEFTSLARLKKLGKITPEEVEKLDISDIPVSYITRPEIKQEFMNIVSARPGAIYRSEVEGKGKIFELKSDMRNIITIFNYFYGINVENIEQIGDKTIGISTEGRMITFTKEDDTNAPNKIKITVRDHKHLHNFTMGIHLKKRHTSFWVPGRKVSNSRFLQRELAKKVLQRKLQDCKGNSIFMFLASAGLLFEENDWSLSVLRIMYYSFFMKKPEFKLKIIKDILERRPNRYGYLKEMIANMIEKFPSHGWYLNVRLIQTIIKTGFYRSEPFFRDFIHTMLCDPQFYDDQEQVVELLRFALVYEHEDIALIIVKSRKFNVNQFGVEYALKEALKRGYKEVASNIIDPVHIRFDLMKQRMLGHCLVLALKNEELKDLGSKIMAHSSFDYWEDALDSAIKNRYDQVALNILGHQRCNVRKNGGGSSFRLAIENDYEEIASKIAATSGFNVNDYWVGNTLKKALEKDYSRIVLMIVNNPEFDARSYTAGNIFTLALNKECLDIALKIIENPRFNINILSLQKILGYTRTILKKRKEGGCLKKIMDIIEAKQKQRDENI